MDATRTTTPLRERMHQELQLTGLSERTQEAYLRLVRQLATHLRLYLLFLKNEKHFAPASLKFGFYRIRFFFRTTAPRDWPTLQELNNGLQGRLRSLQSMFTLGRTGSSAYLHRLLGGTPRLV